MAASVDVLSPIKNTNAYIGSGVSALVNGDIDVSAKSSEGITSVAAGIAVGKAARTHVLCFPFIAVDFGAGARTDDYGNRWVDEKT